jgi:hypothetical protein
MATGGHPIQRSTFCPHQQNQTLDHSKTFIFKIMKYLSQLSPAQTLLLLHGEEVKLRDLLKVTLIDLLLKQCLQTTEITRPAAGKEMPTALTYIIAGPALSAYKPLEQDLVFLDPYLKNEKAQILFANLVKMGYEKAVNEKRYSGLIMRSDLIQDCYYTGIPAFLKGRFTLTQKGQRMAATVRNEVSELGLSFPALLQNDPVKVREILSLIKGNIFVIPGIDIKMLKEIETELTALNAQRYSSGSYSSTDVFTWLAIDAHLHSFDTDWGGDGGCSGCISD